MMSPRPDESINVVHDDSAQLIAVEFELVPFDVKRAFVVTREGEKATRGNHVAGGYQKIILLAGGVDAQLRKSGSDIRSFHLTETGSSILIDPNDYITYELLSVGSQILVLADQSYAQSLEVRKQHN